MDGQEARGALFLRRFKGGVQHMREPYACHGELQFKHRLSGVGLGHANRKWMLPVVSLRRHFLERLV